MKKSELELRRVFKRKITMLEKLLELTSQEELLSEQRREYAALMAVELRSLFCHSGGDPLIKNALMDKELLFPFYDHMTPLNELSDFILVAIHSNGQYCTFDSSLTIALDGTQVPSTWLSYYSWINHIVVDLKAAQYPPLTRENIIKIVADKNGAHVDPDIHPFLELIETSNIMPFNISIDNKPCKADCCNLLNETIYSIAKEAVFAYKYKPLVWSKGKEKEEHRMLRVFDYSFDSYNRYKYMVCNPIINQYSTNRIYGCKISDFPIDLSELLFKNRIFPAYVIKVEGIIPQQGKKERSK
ncbi:MAG: hypothetical protein K5864_08035 [Bacteroidales bacterium]|nr:hypothetical protein [Bacteroidales bacterium]